MCGIVGILSRHDVSERLISSLKRLEYRGYDSAGIATINRGRLNRRRAVGRLENLYNLLSRAPLRGTSGIGHTRWATHGAATITNAHPHRAGPVAVVHNGIIENFRELRSELAEAGYEQESQTDTEAVALLARLYLDCGLTPLEAAKATLKRLHGSFALCFLFDGYDNLMIASRRGSPLVVGHGDGEMFVGSDAVALSDMTDRITYLEEGDWAVITRAGVEIFDERDRLVLRSETRIKREDSQIEKGSYPHFMAKEVAEQPVVVAKLLQRYTTVEDNLCFPAKLSFEGVDRVILVACGTAHYACHVAKYWFEQMAGLPAEIDIASEFRYRDPILQPNSMAIFVSQSGETADTLAALRHVKEKLARTVSVVNAPSSSIARESDLALPIFAGVEVGVASTKAFTCQLTVLALVALKAAADRKHIEQKTVVSHVAALKTLPALMNQALSLSSTVADFAVELAKADDIIFLGRGTMYPLALEGALKVKEVSYIHAEGYASGELKHGPIALIDDRVPVIALAPSDALFDKTVSNMQEVMARNGRGLLVSDADGVEKAGAGTWSNFVMPDVPSLLAPILYAIPAQLLAYHTAVAKGTDVDRPRNLAKSVTVE